ncbi:MAG TPA: glucose-6-phosphate isomerase [Phycisphaerae bacterium]|nr:glucose-6-phosphate isomerase [Phycisphaerae bacterium]
MPADTWQRYKQYFCQTPVAGGVDLDISRMHFHDDLLSRMAAPLDNAFAAMDALEKGAIANPDENRMVGHYWLRNPQLAPTPEIRTEIEQTLARIKSFAADIHSGKRRAQGGVSFDSLLVIGIGGSALGPEFVSDALATPDDKMSVHFFDNTDPDGFDKTLAAIPNLARTLTLVISKSGGTKETRNGMLAAAAAYKSAGLNFAKHAVAITGDGSELDKVAAGMGGDEQWLERFPMWDWVGGRTSELSAVGLLPAALQGIDIDALLAGARDMDAATRSHDLRKNPAALMALMWHHAGSGKGLKDMVVLPYKDRLLLFSRYLQQLVMESLGKEKDRAGNTVHQGIAVYGNKGSTDQHAYVQQLREGINNFFVTFIEVLADVALRGNARPGGGGGWTSEAASAALPVEPDVTSGDYLHGFFQGTRRALAENHRESLTITVHQLSPNAIGALIALFERAVGLYAELININAYHQPGVEAGKKAATAVIALQRKLLAALRDGKTGTADQLAAAIGAPDEAETAFLTLRHLAANPASSHIKIQGAGPSASFSRA